MKVWFYLKKALVFYDAYSNYGFFTKLIRHTFKSVDDMYDEQDSEMKKKTTQDDQFSESAVSREPWRKHLLPETNNQDGMEGAFNNDKPGARE